MQRQPVAGWHAAGVTNDRLCLLFLLIREELWLGWADVGLDPPLYRVDISYSVYGR